MYLLRFLRLIKRIARIVGRLYGIECFRVRDTWSRVKLSLFVSGFRRKIRNVGGIKIDMSMWWKRHILTFIFRAFWQLYFVCYIRNVLFVIFSINALKRKITFPFVLKLTNFLFFLAQLTAQFAAVHYFIANINSKSSISFLFQNKRVFHTCQMMFHGLVSLMDCHWNSFGVPFKSWTVQERLFFTWTKFLLTFLFLSKFSSQKSVVLLSRDSFNQFFQEFFLGRSCFQFSILLSSFILLKSTLNFVGKLIAKT